MAINYLLNKEILRDTALNDREMSFQSIANNN